MEEIFGKEIRDEIVKSWEEEDLVICDCEKETGYVCEKHRK